MKPFHQWVESMANSIEDASHIGPTTSETIELVDPTSQDIERAESDGMGLCGTVVGSVLDKTTIDGLNDKLKQAADAARKHRYIEDDYFE